VRWPPSDWLPSQCLRYDAFGLLATSWLGSIGPSARRFSGRCAGDHNTQGCQDEREWAEDDVLPAALRGEVGNRADRHRDREEPRSPPEQGGVASRVPDDACAAKHDQRRGYVDDAATALAPSWSAERAASAPPQAACPQGAPAASAAWKTAREAKPIAARTAGRRASRPVRVTRSFLLVARFRLFRIGTDELGRAACPDQATPQPPGEPIPCGASRGRVRTVSCGIARGMRRRQIDERAVLEVLASDAAST
jgi:hypothetical protein